MTSFFRIIRYGFLGFWRNKNITAITCFMMVMMISLITCLMLLDKTFDYLVVSLEEKVDMSVYFVETSEESDILEIAEEIKAIPQVKEVEYVSREDALEKFITWHSDSPAIIESLNEVGANPLPPSLNIKTHTPAQYAQVSSFLEQAPFTRMIEKVDYSERKPVIDRLFSLTSGINTIGTIFIVVLAIVAIGVIFNQIRLNIYTRKHEIEIMRLVGASNWFVQGPFVVQGILIGLLSIVITLLIFFAFLSLLNAKISLLAPGLNVLGFFQANLLEIILIQLLIGVGLASIASWLAVRKYLRA